MYAALLQGCDVSLFDKRASARQFGFSRADLSSPTQVLHNYMLFQHLSLSFVVRLEIRVDLQKKLWIKSQFCKFFPTLLFSSLRFPPCSPAGFLLSVEAPCLDRGAPLWSAAPWWQEQVLRQKVWDWLVCPGLRPPLLSRMNPPLTPSCPSPKTQSAWRRQLSITATKS